MASKKKVEKFLYLHEKDKVKSLFESLELLKSTVKKDEPIEEDKVENVSTPVITEATLGTSKACSCCQVKFDSGKIQDAYLQDSKSFLLSGGPEASLQAGLASV